jgi:two-component system response regulator VicR
MQGEGPERILLVEDEGDMAEILRTRLASLGYDVHTESYGAAALSYAISHHPDLIILDVRLPDMGGYDVCRQLRQTFSRAELPVLMFTVKDGPIDDILGFASGANGYLTKRCAIAELFRAVAELLRDRTAEIHAAAPAF